METGDFGDFRIPNSGSFSEIDRPPGLVPRSQIGRLRRLMLTFDTTFVFAGYGRFVAYRLDVVVGLAPRIPLGLTMEHVYSAARSVGLIAVVGDREVPSPSFVMETGRLSLKPCKVCGVGDYVASSTAIDPCWVCLAREEQVVVRAAFESRTEPGDGCRR